MKMSPIKTVVAGTANPHIPFYLNGRREGASELDFLAVADHDEKRLNQAREALRQHSQAVFYQDWREMLDAHPEAEAIIIGNDNKYHFDVFKEAVKRELHIFCMKVISMNENECEEMLRLAEGYGKVIQIELELHFCPQFRYAKKLIEQGKFGKIESIYLTNISQSPINYFPDWGDPELSYGKTIPVKPGSQICRGGGLTDHPHPFDLIRWITGREFKKIFAVSSKNQRDYLRVEDHVAITGELDDGTKVFINPSYSNLEEKVATRRLLWPKSLECNLKITGTEGYYAADFFDKHLYIVGSNYVSPDRLIVDGTDRTNPDKNDNLLGCFAACVRGERERPESTLEDGVAAVRVMNAAYESLYLNKSVELS
jgi:predicted dehydrogenase